MIKTEQQIAEIFSSLIQCPTVTNSGKEYFLRFQDVLKKQFPLTFGTLELIDPSEGSDPKNAAIMLKWKGQSDKRPMVLMAHQDVVPAADGEWKYPSFSGTIADGKVWGRGAMDCKNTLYITIAAVEQLLEDGFKPSNDVYLSYSDNEETSGPGATYVVEWFKKHGVKPVIAVDEGGAIVENAFPGMTKPFAMVGIFEKGYGDIKFIAKSKGGHSSSPPKNTPLARLAAFINYCETHTVFEHRMTTPALAMLNGMSSGLKGPLKFVTKHANALASLIVKVLPKLTPFGNALLGTTMTFTMSSASLAPNAIPQEAWVVANLRFAPGEKSADCIEKVRQIAARYDIQTEVLLAREHSAMVDVNSAEYIYFTDTMKKQFPDIGVSPYLMFGGTDCRRMQEIVPCAIRCTPCRLSPEQLASMHASNENIDIKSLVEGTAFFVEFIKNFR